MDKITGNIAIKAQPGGFGRRRQLTTLIELGSGWCVPHGGSITATSERLSLPARSGALSGSDERSRALCEGRVRRGRGRWVPVMSLVEVHRSVSVPDEVAHRAAVPRPDPAADTRPDRNHGAVEGERLCEGGADAPFGRSHLVGAADVGKDDGELVAAEPGDLVAGPTDVGEALGRLADQFVACLMPVGVVDQLELVEIHEQQAHAPAPRLCFPKDAVDVLPEADPVEQSRQAVVAGPAAQLVDSRPFSTA